MAADGGTTRHSRGRAPERPIKGPFGGEKTKWAVGEVDHFMEVDLSPWKAGLRAGRGLEGGAGGEKGEKGGIILIFIARNQILTA